MKHLAYRLLTTVSFSWLCACGAVKSPVTHQYQLSAFHADKMQRTATHTTLLITPTEAVNGYQTEEMHYSTTTYALNNFTKNAWFSPPATMIYPLIIQSVQHSGYFSAVSSGVYTSKTQYRLDTQLLKLQQNFLKKPSVLELEVKAVVTRVSDNQILASRTFKQQIACPYDSPYGGVIAANKATKRLTKDITQFVIHHATDGRKTPHHA